MCKVQTTGVLWFPLLLVVPELELSTPLSHPTSAGKASPPLDRIPPLTTKSFVTIKTVEAGS